MAYYDPDTGKYFAEIMYASRERREEHDCEITRDMYCKLKTFGDDILPANFHRYFAKNFTYSLDKPRILGYNS